LLNLTIHESIVCDQRLDVEGRERALSDGRALLHEMHLLPPDSFGRAEVDRLLADARVKLLRKLGDGLESEANEGEKLSIHPHVYLLVYDFDDDQKQGAVKKRLAALREKGIKIIAKGKPSDFSLSKDILRIDPAMID
jgi:hypothetical protein